MDTICNLWTFTLAQYAILAFTLLINSNPIFIGSFLTVSYQPTYSDFRSSCSEFYVKQREGIVRIWHS